MVAFLCVLGLAIRNLWLDELRQLLERFLPAKVAHFGRNDGGHSPLHHIHLGAAKHFFQGDRDRDFSGQIRIVKLVRVAKALVRHQFDIFPAEGVTLAGREVCERHLVCAANLGVQVVDLAREAVRRDPLAQGIGLEECAINFLRRRTKDAVKADSMRGHDFIFFFLEGDSSDFAVSITQRMSPGRADIAIVFYELPETDRVHQEERSCSDRHWKRTSAIVNS